MKYYDSNGYQSYSSYSSDYPYASQNMKGKTAANVLYVFSLLFALASFAFLLLLLLDGKAVIFWASAGTVSIAVLLLTIGLFIKRQVIAGIAILLIVPILLSVLGMYYFYAEMDNEEMGGYGDSSSNSYSLSAAYYDAGCSYPWAEHGDDWSYISVDTNPYDYDNSDYPFLSTKYLSVATNAIKNINKSLDLPNSLYKEMEQTTALQGRQTRTYSSQGISVSWTYHPDNGLQVIYTKTAK